MEVNKFLSMVWSLFWLWYLKSHLCFATWVTTLMESGKIQSQLGFVLCLALLHAGIWCDFDRASSLICGNKMPTRCNRSFYYRYYCLLNMFRASLCPSSGAQEYYTLVAACGISCCGFSSSWSGVELRVMRPVCRMLVYQHRANRTQVTRA